MLTTTADEPVSWTVQGEDFASCHVALNVFFDWNATPVTNGTPFIWNARLARLSGLGEAPGRLVVAQFSCDTGFDLVRNGDDCDFIILLPMQGSVRLHYTNDVVDVAAGQVAIYQPLAVRRVETFPEDGRYETGLIKLGFAFAQQFLSETLQYPVERNLNLPPLIERTGDNNLLILNVINLICNLDVQTVGRAMSGTLRRRIVETFSQLLMELLPHRYSERLQSQQAAPMPNHIRLAQRYLDQNALTKPSIADVAKEAKVSVRTLEVNFRTYLDMTPRTYMRVARLRLARQALLSASEARPIADIARAFGFSHSSRFAQYYAELFGETPSDTRRRAES